MFVYQRVFGVFGDVCIARARTHVLTCPQHLREVQVALVAVAASRHQPTEVNATTCKINTP